MNDHEVKYRAVVSDLHLGEGKDLENFIYEPAFIGFVKEVAKRGQEAGGCAELILNGDIVDFLQIAPLAPGSWQLAQQKLDATFRAHSGFFDELRGFVERGNRLVVLVGNHDIELMFEVLQQSFIERVAGGSREMRSRVVFPNHARLDPVRFQGWTEGPFIYRVNGVHIEHGNQLDPVNCFDHSNFYENEAEHLLRLPWGSRFVFSVFNPAASKYRYLDKVRSKTAAGLLLWCLDPELAKELLPGFESLGSKWVNALSGYYLNRHAPVGGGARAVAGGDEPVLALFGEWAKDLKAVFDQPVLPPAGARGDLDLAARIKLVRAAVSKSTIEESSGDDDGYVDGAIAIAERDGAHTVIFGHTHGARNIERDGKRYINTGTWIDRVELNQLDKALRETTGNVWDALEILLTPANFRSEPLLSYAEIVGDRVNLQAW
jgi:UDP-2,3-diacylglucosamine pyrophosphatase LpxH